MAIILNRFPFSYSYFKFAKIRQKQKNRPFKYSKLYAKNDIKREMYIYVKYILSRIII